MTKDEIKLMKIPHQILFQFGRHEPEILLPVASNPCFKYKCVTLLFMKSLVTMPMAGHVFKIVMS